MEAACIIFAVGMLLCTIVVLWRTKSLMNDCDEEIQKLEKQIKEETTRNEQLQGEITYVKTDNERLHNENISIRIENEQLQSKFSSSKCIECGSPSNGKHFCYNCFLKYKGRSVDVRIKNCLIEKVIDQYGNKDYPCTDGTLVRSRAEALIGSFLFEKKVRYIYEKPICYTEKGITQTLYPDFFLPDYDLYFEYNELETEEYLSKKQYAKRIYLEKGLKVETITAEDLKNLNEFFAKRLHTI